VREQETAYFIFLNIRIRFLRAPRRVHSRQSTYARDDDDEDGTDVSKNKKIKIKKNR